MKHHFALLRLPDLITFLGFFSSIAATFCIFEEKFVAAYLLILGQLFADYWDGKVARKMQRQNELGVHLDSFSDFYTIVNVMFFGIFLGIDHISQYVILPIFVGAGMLRLSHFAVFRTTKDNFFMGLPTTAVSFVFPTLLICNYLFLKFDINLFLVCYLLLAIAMITSVKVKKF